MATPHLLVFKAQCQYSQGLPSRRGTSTVVKSLECVPQAWPETTHSHLARSQERALGNREGTLGKQHKLAISGHRAPYAPKAREVT